jgi:hypothetical protein
MSNPTYNISELFSLAFGLGKNFLPVKYVLPQGDQSNTEVKYVMSQEDSNSGQTIKFDIPVIESLEEAMELSSLGTPILFPITFTGRQYNVFDETGKIVQKDVKDFRLPISTICEFSRQKVDTITPLSGGVGSVKELYGFEDWSINIKGICFNDPSHPQAKSPYEQERILRIWENLADAVDITGELFLNKNINHLYIRSINISQIPGKPQFIPFEIQAYSDQIIDLFNNV